jgi:hypothetical protein
VHEDDAHQRLASACRLDRCRAGLGVLVDVPVQSLQVVEGGILTLELESERTIEIK